MSLIVNGTDGVTFNDGTVQPTAPVERNLLINGDMQISQRATTTTGITTTGYHTVDRWKQVLSGGGTYTQAQTALSSGDAFADGFSQSKKYDCTTLYAGVDSLSVHRQVIEGKNLQHLGWGTSSAKSVTLSFWVKSNLTGTAVAGLYGVNSGKQISGTYTIDVANTWEYKTLTFAGDTGFGHTNSVAEALYVNMVMAAGTNYTSGTTQTSWTTYANVDLAAGQTIDVSASISNDISFTGVQLVAGSVATPFQHLGYGQQLTSCQRYYEEIDKQMYNGTVANTRTYWHTMNWKVEKRAVPTVTLTYSTALSFPASVPSVDSESVHGARAFKTCSVTDNSGYFVYTAVAEAEL